MVGSYLEMASAIGWGLEVASLAGKALWLGRHRDAIRPGLWSPVPQASPPFYLFQLNSGCEFRHCLYATAWLRHHKYFNALATGRETQPTVCPRGHTLERPSEESSCTPLRLCRHCRHPLPSVIHTSSRWFCDGDSGYITWGWPLHNEWSKKGFGE